MGADRRGPLAAFIIVAVIAGILLVTSVRSQASPGWLNPVGLPATVVAAPVTGGLDQIVHEGVVLVHRAKTDSVDDPTRTESVGRFDERRHPPGLHASRQRTRHHVSSTQRHHAPAEPHQHGRVPRISPRHDAPSAPPGDPAPPRHDHGRHLGWADHHGQDDRPRTSRRPKRLEPRTPDEYPHGNGHAYGHQKHQRNGHGHGHGQGHEKHPDED